MHADTRAQNEEIHTYTQIDERSAQVGEICKCNETNTTHTCNTTRKKYI